MVHKWRASEQAILVGAGTVRADNPRLNVREWKGSDPLKLILSSSGSLNIGSSVNNTNKKTVVFTHNSTAGIPDVVKVMLKERIHSSAQICEYLYSSGIQSLFIEGGAEVLNHFISTGLWDEARVFTGEEHFREGVKAPVISGVLFSKTIFSGSILEIYLKNGS
jgi:diaminohydroxyphosphoribosylaminopyrimidine deaminase/5-amino-6-(5-phosphoribosylamino)uracil reductase